MKMKKAIAILSAAGLLLSGTPVSPLQSLTVSAAQSDIESGHLTDTIDWSMDLTNGVLTITGEGAMPDYTYEDLDARTWNMYCASIKKLLFQKASQVSAIFRSFTFFL
ncbi:MAG: hypothetical protein IKG82_15080 [Oscillospiraceae bacterium]|nr:hypothetical protein [Oscillospiraceae bacterium]